MSDASHYEVSREFLGRRCVNYECPHCGDRLRSPLRDAGNRDSCPTCQGSYVVPGIEVLNQVATAKQAAEQYAAKIKAERQEAKRQREMERATAHAQEAKAAEDARLERERLAEEARQAKMLANASTQANANPEIRATSHRMWWTTGVAAAIVISLSLVYGVLRGADLRAKLEQCESNGIVKVRVNYSGPFSDETVIFDLCNESAPGARRIDPVHLLMQFAGRLDLFAVRRVVLARDGKPRFYITGSDLRPLADSYANGGRIWAFNNLPANVRRMDGARAFDEWTGGWLGVLKEQSKDVNQFITEWTGYGDAGFSANSNSTNRARVREMLNEMEGNVPDTLKAMEDNLPQVMADMENDMMDNAAKFGLSPSDVRAQLRGIEDEARQNIRGMENGVREQIRGMEDDIIESLQSQDQ